MESIVALNGRCGPVEAVSMRILWKPQTMHIYGRKLQI